MTTDKESPLVFPCDFPIKVFGLASDTFQSNIVSIVREVLPAFNDHDVEKRESGAGKYYSLTLNVHVKSREELDEVYRRLSGSALVLMVL